jgi:putative transposase
MELHARDRVIERRETPRAIRVDNSPDYIGGQLLEWPETHSIAIQHIQPGMPQQNA